MTEPFTMQPGPTGDGVSSIRVAGRLDSASAPLLAQRCAAVAASGSDLVLELSGVSFIASSGVGALLATAERFRESGHALTLACLPPPVAAVIQLLNLDRFLEIVDSEERAVRRDRAA
jgi:anti-sigma B factor antagonist